MKHDIMEIHINYFKHLRLSLFHFFPFSYR